MDKNRNWENGDVLVDVLTKEPFLFWKMEGGKIFSHCGIDNEGRFCLGCEDWSNPKGCRLATMEEKKRLRAEMKKRGLVFVAERGYVDIIHENAICYTALEHYGLHHQIMKCMEECGELIQALAKNMCGEHYAENVAEELADVEIMLMQMRMAFGRSRVDRVMAQKLARLKMRMEEEET
jgi:NTP pyrophosphatase (non-canonical NTP hydrolase)